MGIAAEEHLVYYVSDMLLPPSSGHSRKMDAGREIAEYICREMHNAGPVKYTEYNGEKIFARSVGIVFPAYIWGCSLAVYSFLQQLRGRIGKDTYVYAVAVGENLSGSVLETVDRRMYSLGEFRRIFVKCQLGTEADIYVRCIDMADDAGRGARAGRTEEKGVEKLKCILSALLFRDIRALSADSRPLEIQYTEEVPDADDAPALVSGKRKLENVFLDESMLSGVRMCRVM